MQVEASLPLSLPEGEDENSPGCSPQSRTKPWGRAPDAAGASPRAARSSPPHIARVVIHLVLLQKREEFRLEIALPMMLFLARDVIHSTIDLSPSDGECSIPLLPFKALHRTGFVHPVRRCAFDFPHRFGNRHRCGKRRERVNVIFGATDCEGHDPVLACDSSHVSPQPRLVFRRDGSLALFGREDAVKQCTTIGV